MSINEIFDRYGDEKFREMERRYFIEMAKQDNIIFATGGGVILNQDSSVKGFNIGTNAGKSAGQSIMHCHIHLIPRREGDVENPQGGVRSSGSW